MKAADDFSQPPQGYNLITPEGWFQIPLNPEERDRSISALAERQFNGLDNAPLLKSEFMRDLQKKARDSYALGGTELYLSTLTIGPVPLASSLLISVPAPDEWPSISDVDEMSEHLADRASQNSSHKAEGGYELTVVELAVAGRAVRQRRREAADPTAQMGNTLPTTTLTYYVPIPASALWLLMNFSTPVDPLADQIVELFDVVAGTLHWT
ncbi:hypothetical protein [Streptomyces sp. NPDC048309]|uniref:hypothetical protein n=1 Tax=unclassified Streptomyces TaxID=2593676 RepID=UPI0033C6D9EF